jgi:hypothetical protein
LVFHHQKEMLRTIEAHFIESKPNPMLEIRFR